MEHGIQAMKWEYLAQPAGIMSPALSRIAFCMYMLKFVGTSKNKRNLFYFIIVSQLIINLGTMVEVLISCEHFAQLWDSRLHGRCWSPKIQAYLGFFQGGKSTRFSSLCSHPNRPPAWNSTSDLVLTVLPITILKNLNMELRTKVALCILMGLSFFAMIACIVKTVELRALGDRMDFTHGTANFVIWFTIEQYIVIIAASVPTIRPLALRLSQNWKNRTPSGTANGSRRPARRPEPPSPPGGNDQDGSNDLSWSSTSPPHPVRLINTPELENFIGKFEVESPYVHPSPKSPPPVGTIRKTISVVIKCESVDENLDQTRGVCTTISAGLVTPEQSAAVAIPLNEWPFPDTEESEDKSK